MLQMSEWSDAFMKLASLVKVVKPVTLISPEESTEGGKRDVWDAFRKRKVW